METQAEVVVAIGIASVVRVEPPHPQVVSPRSPGIVEVVSEPVVGIEGIVSSITHGEIVESRAEGLSGRQQLLAVSGVNTADAVGELAGDIHVGAAHSSVAKPVGEAKGEVQVVQQGRLGLRVGLAQNENCQGTQDNLGGELYRGV